MFSDRITSQLGAEHRRDLRVGACRARAAAAARPDRRPGLWRRRRTSAVLPGKGPIVC